MTDNPYSLDFLQQITKVQFGVQWLTIAALGFTDQAEKITVDFPDISGGTPGFTLLDAASLPPPKFLGSPHQVTAKDISHGLITEAGAPLTGFGLKVFDFPIAGPTGRGAQVFIALNHFLPSTPFRVTVFGTNTNTSGLGFVGTMKKDSMKANTIVDGLGEFSGHNQYFQTADFGAVPAGTTLVVDPKTLTVVPG